MDNTAQNVTSRPGVETPAKWEQVLDREMQEVNTRRGLHKNPKLANEPEIELSDNTTPPADLFGLAFSGGGIRSATLNLGILQGLAKRGLLQRIDYLSTVSGGGYIGSWLTSWIKRTKSEPGKTSTQIIEDRLVRATKERPDEPEFRPIAYLRQFSNYLTPKVSLFSADTRVVAAIWLRNTALNQTILMGIFIAVLALARLLGALVPPQVSTTYDLIGPFGEMSGVAFLLLLLATNATGDNLKQIIVNASRPQPVWPVSSYQESIQRRIVVPVIVASSVVSIWLYLYSAYFTRQSFWASVVAPTLVFAVLFFWVPWRADFRRCFEGEHASSKKARAGLRGLEILITLGPAFVTAALLVGLAHLISFWNGDQSQRWIAICFGAPAVMWVFASGMVLQIGLMGHDLYDSCREWLGRLRAWLLIYSLVWLAFFAASVWGPYWMASIVGWSGWTGLGITGAWVATTIAGLIAGNGAKTNGTPAPVGKSAPSPISELIAHIAPYAFMVGVILAVACAVHWLTAVRGKPEENPPAPTAVWTLRATDSDKPIVVKEAEQPKPMFPSIAAEQRDYWRLRMQEIRNQIFLLRLRRILLGISTQKADPSIRDLDILFLAALAVALILSLRVNINDFSLHHFYKNRLVRCYLGASRGTERKPNPFTGFDFQDEVPVDTLSPLAPRSETENVYTGPIHIINTTLNLSAGSNLALQERKGSSFIFTSLFTGFRPDPGLLALGVEQEGYRRTFDYAYSRTKGYQTYDRKVARSGIGLGTAIAISGAAASPNSGYHTSTAVAFLMTLFDVRLGWWLGNPIDPKTYRKSGPTLGLLYLFRELFGLSDDNQQLHQPVRWRALREYGYLRAGPPQVPLHHLGRRGAR